MKASVKCLLNAKIIITWEKEAIILQSQVVFYFQKINI